MKKYLVRLLAFCVAINQMGAVESKSAEIAGKRVPFLVYQATPGFQLPQIVLQYDAVKKTGANWMEVSHPQWYEVTPAADSGRAANYLRDGLKRMTGKDYSIVSSNDLSKGIVLTLLKNSSPDIKKDPEVRQALKIDSKDPYSWNEAYYLRSEKDRVLVVANTSDGLTDAVVELLESVDYEVLGMGPDWIYAPDHRNNSLIFSLNRSGRPDFYIRQLWATSGQSYGLGTIADGLTDPADETVFVSYERWLIGSRTYGKSMPLFPGEVLQIYHSQIIEKMRDLNSTHGFYADFGMGLESKRPPAGLDLNNHWWINTDPKGASGFGKLSSCDGKAWTEHSVDDGINLNLHADTTAPIVRDVVFEAMKRQATASFTATPDEPVIFATEAEDGGVGDAEQYRTMADRNWYPEYLAKEKLPFGRPYILNGYKGLNQPNEIWDPTSASDLEFGFANYLLHEFDKWIDSLPKDQQVTSTGKSKKQLIRCSFCSYDFDDVPPDFNPDKRIRIEAAGYPKHRGTGKWEKIVTQEDVAKALHIMLPNDPIADYAFYSEAFYDDGGPMGIPCGWSQSSVSIADNYHRLYHIDCRSITREIDFNFGKCGLGYYLALKMLWNAHLTNAALDHIRDRWFQCSFGSAWEEMKSYYDFMLKDNYTVNSPNTWAKAIRLIDLADKKVNSSREPEAQRRIDDLKQYWYAHYLMDTGKYTLDSPEVKEFLWKGQMSYMTGMCGLIPRVFKSNDVKKVVGPQISAGPAHYTHAETQIWWPKILDTWKVTPVSLFSEAALANGMPAKNVDLNDLVMVNEFQTKPTDVPYLYNSGLMKPMSFLSVALKQEDTIGFKLVWPYNPADSYYAVRKVHYGAERWDSTEKKWETWIDQSMAAQTSVEVDGPQTNGPGSGKLQVVDVERKASRPGVYRFSVGYGGNLSILTSPTYDPVSSKYIKPMSFTYFTNAEGLEQTDIFFYIPKGTKSLDLEVGDTANNKFVTLYKGLPSAGFTISRKLNISEMGVHKIPLESGEDGSFAMMGGINFCFPFLYSVPTFWAKSPSALLIPRAIAQADGLTISK